MGNYLETIPCDILQYIALLATLDPQPVSTTLHSVSSLLLTSSTLYRSLCIKSCPHLYADIFRATFDTCAGRRRFTFQLTDSALACELVFRHKMLRNVRHRLFLQAGLRQDLWTAFWMIQESDGLNELHLHFAGIVKYLLDIIKHWANGNVSREGDSTRELEPLVIWLLCFTLSQECILSLSPDVRDILQKTLLPHTWDGHRPSAINTSFLLSELPDHDQLSRPNYTRPSAEDSITHQRYRHPPAENPIVIYARNWVSRCPDPAPGAINILFCLKESPMKVPPELPDTRLIANATQRSGPTKEDIWKIRGYRTKLFADTNSWSHSLDYSVNDRSETHDFEFQRMISADQGTTESRALPAMRGRLAGIWEGFYLMVNVVMPEPGTIGEPHHGSPDFKLQWPLQAVFTEFVCLDSSESNLPSLDDISGKRNLLKMNSQTRGGFELDGHKYERLIPDSDSNSERDSQREAREPVDILLLGETLEDHSQAWGGFQYAGRIRKDGSVILKRVPKEAGGNGFSGVWIFEGRIRFGTVLVGTCYSSAMNNAFSLQGIFSMQKRANDTTSW